MQPQSGTWIGTFTMSDTGSHVQVMAQLRVEDDGSIAGQLTVFPGEFKWPIASTNASLTAGGYSDHGTLHMGVEDDDNNLVTFDGRFEAPTVSSGVIWGTVAVFFEEKSRKGTLSLVFAGQNAPAPVQGDVIASRVW